MTQLISIQHQVELSSFALNRADEANFNNLHGGNRKATALA